MKVTEGQRFLIAALVFLAIAVVAAGGLAVSVFAEPAVLPTPTPSPHTPTPPPTGVELSGFAGQSTVGWWGWWSDKGVLQLSLVVLLIAAAAMTLILLLERFFRS